jgi:hypothetical protein
VVGSAEVTPNRRPLRVWARAHEEATSRSMPFPGIGRGLEAWLNFLPREGHSLQSKQGQPNLKYLANACARF